jgi:hypothetical protein
MWHNFNFRRMRLGGVHVRGDAGFGVWPAKISPHWFMRKEIVGGIIALIIWALVGVWLFSGCVSVAAYRRDVAQARIEAMQKCRKVAYYNHSEETVKQINLLIKKQELK